MRGCSVSDRPAFVPRSGMPGPRVIETIHAAAGIASLAHPGSATAQMIEQLAAAGLDAIEVWHSDHSPEQQEH